MLYLYKLSNGLRFYATEAVGDAIVASFSERSDRWRHVCLEYKNAIDVVESLEAWWTDE